MSHLILIGGPSGAGKSHLAEGLARALAGDECALLALDDYYYDLTYLSEERRAGQNFDHPDALDWELLLAHVRTLLAGQPIERPAYDFATHTRRAEPVTVQPGKVLILDGLLALAHDALLDFASVRVFVNAPQTVCFERRLQRDTADRGRTEESIRGQFWGSVWPMAERYVLPTRACADVVVAGDLPLDEGVELVLRKLGRSIRP